MRNIGKVKINPEIITSGALKKGLQRNTIKSERKPKMLLSEKPYEKSSNWCLHERNRRRQKEQHLIEQRLISRRSKLKP